MRIIESFPLKVAEQKIEGTLGALERAVETSKSSQDIRVLSEMITQFDEYRSRKERLKQAERELHNAQDSVNSLKDREYKYND